MNSSALNISCLTLANCSDVAEFYVALGALHILLVIIPVLVIGPIVLGIFISNKKLRDPVAFLYICTATICIIGPLTYGLLMDLTLITTLEVFGSCDTKSPRTFWILFSTFQSQLLACNALLSAVQYFTIKWGRKVTIRAVMGIFFFLFVVIFLCNMIHLVGASKEEHIRGSLCRHPGETVPYAYALVTLFTIGVLTIPPFILVVVFSILTAVHIKKNTIKNGQPAKTVLKIVLIWTFTVIFLRCLPILVILLGFDTTITPISVILVRSVYGIYSVELSNPLFLFLALFLHRTVRITFLDKIKKICQMIKSKMFANKVSPSGLSGEDVLPPIQITVTRLETFTSD